MKIRTLLVQLLKGIGKTALAFAILLACAMAFDFYKAYPTRKFCAELSATAIPEEVADLAKTKGLLVTPISPTGSVSVLNQRAPFFRHACVVSFQGGRLMSKEAIAAD